MKEKLLSISIACYNVEKYLENTLNSCAIPEIIDDIEVIVVNDGSTDKTINIANKFKEKFPNSFVVIDKENEGYGSTLNRSMSIAKGKYFKLLDGDDWLDKEGLVFLINLLKINDVDLIVSSYFDVENETNIKKKHKDSWFIKDQKFFLPTEIDFPFTIGIWGITVKTSILKENSFVLPKNTLYTDQLFVANIIPHVQSILFSDKEVYCYRVGRNEQSVSKSSRIKHFKESIFIVKEIINVFNQKQEISIQNGTFNIFLSRCSYNYLWNLKGLLLPKGSKEMLNNIISLENYAMKNANKIYQQASKISKKILLLRITNYLFYWMLCGK